MRTVRGRGKLGDEAALACDHQSTASDGAAPARTEVTADAFESPERAASMKSMRWGAVGAIVVSVYSLSGCVWVTEIAIELPPIADATIEEVQVDIARSLESLDEGLQLGAGQPTWQVEDAEATATLVCTASDRSLCVWARIDNRSLIVRFSITSDEPRGCFGASDYAWAQAVAKGILAASEGRGRIVRDSGLCST